MSSLDLISLGVRQFSRVAAHFVPEGTFAEDFFKSLGGDSFGSLEGLSGTERLEALFNRQMAAQQQHEQFSLMTNLARTEHESRMAAIRNMRA